MSKRLELNRDTQPIDQPEGTLTTAKNVVITEDFGSLVYEKGNFEWKDLGVNILGFCSLSDNGILLFYNQAGNGVITLYRDYQFHTILEDAELSFDGQIQADCIPNRGDEWVVVWTDNINPPRYHEFEMPTNVNTNYSLNVLNQGDTYQLTVLPVGGNSIIFVRIEELGVTLANTDYIFTGLKFNKNYTIHIKFADGYVRREYINEQ